MIRQRGSPHSRTSIDIEECSYDSEEAILSPANDDDWKYYQPPTELHRLLIPKKKDDESIQLDETISVQEAATTDYFGRTPFHLAALHSDCLPLVDRLLVYPAALIVTDHRGEIPFQRKITDWIDETMHQSASKRHSVTWSTAWKQYYSLHHSQTDVQQQQRSSFIPIHPVVPDKVITTLDTIQYIINHLEATEDDESSIALPGRGLQKQANLDIANEIIATFAEQPHFVKILLLIDEDSRPKQPFLQRVITHPNAIGPWINDLIHHGKKEIALNYLLQLQQVRSPEIDQALAQLPDLVSSLLELDTISLEEVATTELIINLLDTILSRPFSSLVIFTDGIMLAVLIVGFRKVVHEFLVQHKDDPGMYLANASTLYFTIREIGKLWIVSRNWHFQFRDFWEFTDFAAIAISLASSAAIRWRPAQEHRVLLALTTFFLWLRVLSFLKGVNRQLATFVLAIIQITRDILWFCVILVVLVVSFAQIFFTLLVPSEGCEDAANRECMQGEYYLKVYAILLGDFGLFDREQFDSWLSTFIAVLYTFMVVLVLLNVLIAVASDSYEKCLIRSQNLFGRARVMMVSELVAFQRLLQKDNRLSQLFWSVLICLGIVWFSAELVNFAFRGDASRLWLNILPLASNLVIFLFFRYATKAKTHGSDSTMGVVESWIQRVVRRVLANSTDGRNFHENWQGRLVFLQDKLERQAREAEEDRANHLHHLETLLRRMEESLKKEQ